MDTISDPIGGTWLVRKYSLGLVMPLATMSGIGGRRSSQINDGPTHETYVEAMRPDATLRGHLTFHLKHEAPHLELLSRLFSAHAFDPQELATWFNDEPTGQYVRRACFLYEWLTGKQLAVQAGTPVGYVDALDAKRVVVASPDKAVPNRRWRVRDNLPGSPAFCPIIRKTPQLTASMSLDVAALLAELGAEFGDDLLMKSAVWMTLRESRSSFQIEGEADKADRIQRFASVLGRRTGQGDLPLSNAALAELQTEILGQVTSLQQFGIRSSPIFVGEVHGYQELVHYVAPPPEDLRSMLEGLATFIDRTSGQSPVMRSAVAAFGFVYIHPLADGNGRVHRFLINDILRRDGVVKDPLILPVSSLITSDGTERRAYDRILEMISRPLMQSLAGHYGFGERTAYPDGITSNLKFTGNDSARHVWRLMDLSRHVSYLAGVVERTIKEDMRDQSRYMRRHAQARAAIKDIIEMPDAQIDRVIRSIEANKGVLTHVLAKEIPALGKEGVWDAVVSALKASFQSDS
ncbi:MAG: Fic family protein [Burkholderiaceae bacterium]|nr:Fic family protein [Burkholderiaceae bacterium]MDP1968755.1 Fic family protein [Burkholderiaceae bacterium]